MILYKGKIYGTEKTVDLLEKLKNDVDETLLNKSIDTERLIAAVDEISNRISKGAYDKLINEIDVDGLDEYVAAAAQMLHSDNLRLNIKAQTPHLTELPDINSYIAPVGALFHIAAGNVDVLPAYSVLSGLVCGNVNILKLPSQDNGITVKILSELIKIMPELSDFIYVFDTPSSDLPSMLKMAEAADKIIVWGGDGAVAAVRRFAPPQIPVVSWGHKISFACIGSDYEKRADELYGLAEHIIKTSQLLCSSCQRIYINSDKPEDADGFCRFFLPILQKARDKYPLKDLGAAAEATLLDLTAETEGSIGGKPKNTARKYAGKGCSLTAKDEKTLEISGFFGSCDVTSCSLNELFNVLREKKGYLQTATVIADEKTRAEFENIAVRAGVCRITSPADMSRAFLGEAHDGQFELSNYVRIINKEV